MISWRDRLLQDFLPNAYTLAIVADRDYLFDDLELQEKLAKSGYKLLVYGGDSIAFRYQYEIKYRIKTEGVGVIVIVHGNLNAARQLPYDILCCANLLSFGLSDLFPYLSDTIIAQCDQIHLDTIFAAAQALPPQPLNETATKDFLLGSIFNLDAKAIQNDIELLRALLQLHYQGSSLPSVLTEHLVEILKIKSQFVMWDLETIVANRQSFFTWLQAQWQSFVLEKIHHLKEPSTQYVVRSQVLPLDNPSIRIYIDNLFREGFLQPISAQDVAVRTTELQGNEWLLTGMAINAESDHQIYLQETLTEIEARLLKFKAQLPSYKDWLALAPIWARAIVYRHAVDSQDSWRDRWYALQKQLDDTFLDWIQQHYDELYNQPVGSTPVMLHQVPKFLARQLPKRIALVVLDGMAFDQWLVLRDVLIEQMGNSLCFCEGAAFAMLPTLTSVSRQAIFAGKLPTFMANSLNTTAKESKHWQAFWRHYDLVGENIAYLNIIGNPADLEKVSEVLAHPKRKVLGLVVNKIDRIMHGMEMGTAGMHMQVSQWTKQGFMKNLLDMLRAHNFHIFLTADHGNLEVRGIGQPSERAFAELRGERVRIYPDITLCEHIRASFPGTIAWVPKILPPDWIPLFASHRNAFVTYNEQLVCHGGISLEEVIIPFISIE